jgi:hypothetical protein
MFHRVHVIFPRLVIGGDSYQPRAYADSRADGMWDGWLVFFSDSGRGAIAPDLPATTQPSLSAVGSWAALLNPMELESALARAITINAVPPGFSTLTAAELAATEDAEALERDAALERASAERDEAAAAAARQDAEELHDARLVAQQVTATEEQLLAESTAQLHKEAADAAREVAAAAAKRGRRAVRADPTTKKKASGRTRKKKG